MKKITGLLVLFISLNIQISMIFQEDSSNFPIISETAQSLRRRMRRLSSGDLNVIRRMTEEIDFDLKVIFEWLIYFNPLPKFQNIIYDGNEITGETDADNGNDRACFKPGPDYPIGFLLF